MKKSQLIVILLTMGLVSCNSSKPMTPNATNCATAVQSYLGFVDPVAVTQYTEQPNTQAVEIEYQSQNDENIAVNGIASCVFERDEKGEIRLINATIDNQTLSQSDLTSLNQQVKFSP